MDFKLQEDEASMSSLTLPSIPHVEDLRSPTKQLNAAIFQVDEEDISDEDDSMDDSVIFVKEVTNSNIEEAPTPDAMDFDAGDVNVIDIRSPPKNTPPQPVEAPQVPAAAEAAVDGPEVHAAAGLPPQPAVVQQEQLVVRGGAGRGRGHVRGGRVNHGGGRLQPVVINTVVVNNFFINTTNNTTNNNTTNNTANTTNNTNNTNTNHHGPQCDHNSLPRRVGTYRALYPGREYAWCPLCRRSIYF